MKSYSTNNRDACFRLFGQALSRYNGLTNSAKLEYITKLLLDELTNKSGKSFDEDPFLYASDVREKFADGMKPRSAEVLLQHAISFGFVYRATKGSKSRHSTLATRVEALSHIALTPLGRTMRSVKCLDDESESLKFFLWEYALLENDFDMYGLMIKMTEENNSKLISCKALFDKFDEIRKMQLDWMIKAIEIKKIRQEIQLQLSWIGELKDTGRRTRKGETIKKRQFKLDAFSKLSDTSKNHHHGQRRRWAENFKHIKNHQLTDRGKLLAKKLPATDSLPFFWLAPPSKCIESRWMPFIEFPGRSYAPAWNLLRPDGDDKEPSDELVQKVTDYMVKSFRWVKLANFQQSSFDVVEPYIYFLESQLGERVNLTQLFEIVLQANKDKFVGTLRADWSKSYYHLRRV